MPSKKGNNKFLRITYKEQEVFSGRDMRGKKCIRLTGFSKNELANDIVLLEL